MLFLQAQQGSPFSTLIFLGAILGVAYFFLIRPNNKAKDEQKKFNSNIKKGDKIVTAGGLHGVVLELTDTTVTLLVDKDSKTKMVYSKDAISYDMTKAAYPNVEA
jgi:preprotein translocase subunit YajC